MEVTLLIEATESAFKILEDARNHAAGIMDTTVELMAEESRVLRDKKCRAIFTGAQRRKTRFHNFMGTAIILFIFWSLLSGHFDLFHLVLGKDSPSFLPVPGTTTVLPLAEVIRGYFLTEIPELGKDQHNMFRFTTGTATIREAAPPSDLRVQGSEEAALEATVDAGPGPSTPPQFVETRQSVVVRILANRNMPESDQGQLLRALEGQVGPRNTLVGWSDMFPVPGPLGLSGIEGLLELLDD